MSDRQAPYSLQPRRASSALPKPVRASLDPPTVSSSITKTPMSVPFLGSWCDPENPPSSTNFDKAPSSVAKTRNVSKLHLCRMVSDWTPRNSSFVV